MSAGRPLSAPGSSGAPAVTVVVVNYNGGAHLKACLASLARQTFRDFEVILIDNASSDGSLDAIEDTPAQLTLMRQSSNLGFAAANNIGARAGCGRWLALLNPDAVADPDWLEQALDALQKRPDHRLIASLQVMSDDPSRLDGCGDCYLGFGFAWRGGYGHPVGAAPSAGTCFAPCAAAAIYPRDRFLELGGFCERYFCYHEDVDLGFRMLLAGEKTQFAPGARVRHAGSAISGRSSRFSVYHGVRNSVSTFLRNLPAPMLIVATPIWALGCLALLARAATMGRFRATLDGLVAGLSAAPQAVRERGPIQSARRAKLRDIASALSWNPADFLRRAPRVTPFPAAREDHSFGAMRSNSANARNR